MDDIKAIDIQNRIFSVRPDPYFKDIFDTYEAKIQMQTTFKGIVLKAGMKPGEEWKAMISQWPCSVPNMLKEMDDVGIELVFIDQFRLWSYHEHRIPVMVTLEAMDEIVTEGGGRIIPGGGYNPFRIRESLEELEKGVKEHGFKYVWAHPITYGIPLDDRRNYPLYAKCDELGIPLTLQVGHSAEVLPCEGGRPYYMDVVAVDFPNLKIVLTHTGWPWVDEWISMCWRHPNVYGCINAYYPKSLDPAVVKFMDGRGRDKVMWGTNALSLKRCKEEFLELPIRDESRKKVLRDNAIKVFNLD
ncbi:amidohydrolase family protein [Chloroflexota bacterium]